MAVIFMPVFDSGSTGFAADSSCQDWDVRLCNQSLSG